MEVTSLCVEASNMEAAGQALPDLPCPQGAQPSSS